MKSSTSPRDRLASMVSRANVDSPEQLGVLLTKSVLRSALQYKITSEDGKSLVVPIRISLRPLRRDPATETTVVDCYSECWKVFGANVYCKVTCTSGQNPVFAPPADDELLAQITPGPPLLNPELVEPRLQRAILTAATSAEVGVLASNAVASAVRDHPELIRDDGSVEITATATVSLPDPTTEVGVEVCTETCWQILGHNIVCHEVCTVHLQ
jgi:hypothetical protein